MSEINKGILYRDKEGILYHHLKSDRIEVIMMYHPDWDGDISKYTIKDGGKKKYKSSYPKVDQEILEETKKKESREDKTGYSTGQGT